MLTGRFPWWPSLKNLTTAEVMECVVHKKVCRVLFLFSCCAPNPTPLATTDVVRQLGDTFALSSALPQVPYDMEVWSGFSDDAYDFTKSLLRRQSGKRLSASDALNHPWIQMHLVKYNQHSDFDAW